MPSFPRHRARARRAASAEPPPVSRDPDLLQSFLSDAAHVPGGSADAVAFPTTTADAAAVIAAATHVLAVGAQSSLTGGATPRGDLVLSTRNLARIDEPRDGTIRVDAGVPLSALQHSLAARRLYYPPVPTFDGAFIGGTLATNAAGAATFRYGSARDWVNAITVVLADGSILDLQRGDVRASTEHTFEIQMANGDVTTIPLPSYAMPSLPKLSAGYFNAPEMDLVDLFVGSEGTLGVITEATLRVTPRPLVSVALLTCESDAQALDVTTALRDASRTGADAGGIGVIAIEYMDARSIRLLDTATLDRAGVNRLAPDAALLLVQIETGGDPEPTFVSLQALLDDLRVTADPIVALADDDRAAARLFELRESVPAAVNARVAAAKARVDPSIQKTAGDFVVPFGSMREALALYRGACERRGLEYAIWGHVSDGNLHPNIIPQSLDDLEKGRDALREMALGVIEMGGAPLAEHGVGRNPLKQSFLVDMYGAGGVEQMRAVKRALDPRWKLAAGVLFPP